MTNEELTAIEARAEGVLQGVWNVPIMNMICATDIPALCAEVRRLQNNEAVLLKNLGLQQLQLSDLSLELKAVIRDRERFQAELEHTYDAGRLSLQSINVPVSDD